MLSTNQMTLRRGRTLILTKVGVFHFFLLVSSVQLTQCSTLSDPVPAELEPPRSGPDSDSSSPSHSLVSSWSPPVGLLSDTYVQKISGGHKGQEELRKESPPTLARIATQKFLSQTPSILYTAVVKGKVALPCDVTPPTPDDSVALILWYKDDALAPIYTLDARKGNLDQARTLTTTYLEGRAYFNLHNRPAFLQIDPIQLSDAGDYRCRVDFKKARTVNTVISLKVIVPPDEPQVKSMDGAELKGLIGPFNEGEELKVTCTTNGGKPRPSLTWWRDYMVIDDSFEYNDKDVTTNQLTIPSLARHHLLSIFTCQAINNNITVPSSTSITLDLNLKPTEVHITQLTPVIVADREASFECSTLGSRPRAILYWLFDNQRHNTTIHVDPLTYTSITIIPKQTHNGKWLTCVAENTKIPHSSVSDKLKLDIQYIPQLSLQLGSPTLSLQTIQEGNDIYFDCHIDANPRPNKPIIWRFNGNILHPQQGIIQSNQTLVLQRVSRAQSGAYQCEASNQQGIALSNAINLKIRYAPVCRTDFILVYEASIHETVDLECDVEANPPHVSFQWKFQATTDLVSFNQINDTSSILSYTPRAHQEFGTVQCIAKNDVGLQQKSCSFEIIQGSRPKFPFNCQVVNQSDNSLVILCVYNAHIELTPSADEQRIFVYPRTMYICEVYDASNSYLVANVSTSPTFSHPSSSPSADTTNNNLHFLITNLDAATHFRLKLFAQNSKGRSNETWLKAQTLRPAERLVDSNSSGSNPSGFNQVSTALLRGKPVLVALLVGAAVVTLIVVSLGIIAVLRVSRTTSGPSVCSSAQPTAQQSGASTLFSEEEDDCCCDDDCCDEMLLTSTTVQQQQEQGNNGSKGPPDIIPSFGYPVSGLDNKQFISYDYPQDAQEASNTNALHYAELSFSSHNNSTSKQTLQCQQLNIHHHHHQQQQQQQQHPQHPQQQQQPVEYAKIEFAKTPRVTFIGGSPKFESTV